MQGKITRRLDKTAESEVRQERSAANRSTVRESPLLGENLSHSGASPLRSGHQCLLPEPGAVRDTVPGTRSARVRRRSPRIFGPGAMSESLPYKIHSEALPPRFSSSSGFQESLFSRAFFSAVAEMGRLLAASVFFQMLPCTPETIRHARCAKQPPCSIGVFRKPASVQGGASAEAKSSAIQLLGASCLRFAGSKLIGSSCDHGRLKLVSFAFQATVASHCH